MRNLTRIAFILIAVCSVVNAQSIPIEITPIMDMRLEKGDLIFNGETFVQSLWIEVRSADGLPRKIVQLQNAIEINDVAFRDQIKSVKMSDWIISEENYVMHERYTPPAGVLEWAFRNREMMPYSELGGPDAETWSKVARIDIEFTVAKDEESIAYIDWYGYTPNYNVRAIKLNEPGSEVITGQELGGDIIVDATLTKVELSGYSAMSENGLITLNWSTADEMDNAGFYVDRAIKKDGPFERLTQELITGSLQYQYTDEKVEIGQEYTYRLVAVSRNGILQMLGTVSQKAEAPRAYKLEQNYPNPFNPETTINYQIKDAGDVSIQIYNMRGQLVRNLMRQNMKAGFYSSVWDGRNEQGLPLSSGVYIYRIKVNDFTYTRKMQLMK
ncbi:T9SS type A sorting domain-containing protein [candidate division KSB1 bacterium]|nr:T9SS type A sorting domain-containing protein [candidate division KSB1 bacterium]